jgi:membrane-bound lytic murein transglycosylase F
MVTRFFIFAVLILCSCQQQSNTEDLVQSSDSLLTEIQRLVAEKQRVDVFRERFERSRYHRYVLDYKPYIKKYAKRYGFDWRLIVAQIMQESRFNTNARSPVGARGLMQIMPGTEMELRRELDLEKIRIYPRENIAAGIYHMKKQFQMFPNADLENRLKLSLASYNCGVGRILDAQDIARFHRKEANNWHLIKEYLSKLKKSDWELHLEVWPQGKPTHGYFYGYQETIAYVDNIWDLYDIYQHIL